MSITITIPRCGATRSLPVLGEQLLILAAAAAGLGPIGQAVLVTALRVGRGGGGPAR